MAGRIQMAEPLCTRRVVGLDFSSGMLAEARRQLNRVQSEEGRGSHRGSGKAERANVGVSWYTLLEQGRDIHPSSEVLQSIAEALQLTPDEQQHLFRVDELNGKCKAGVVGRAVELERKVFRRL